MKIGIAGFGFVGQAVVSCLNHEDFVIYDPPKGFENINVLFDCPVIFCCLPTPTVDGKQDFSYYEGFFESLGGYNGIVVVKSTVLFSNIEPYLDKFNLVLNPEFLSQNNFIEDFYKQKVIVLGGRIDHCLKARDAYTENFNFESSPQFELCSAKEAIDIKYAHNIYHAYKVLFWNYIHELSGNQRKIFSVYSKLRGTSISNEMAQIFADGKPGYGGACFPKDTAAMEGDCPHVLTKFMLDYNFYLRGIRDKDE